MAEPRFVNGFVDGADLVLLHRDESGRLLKRIRRAEWGSFFRRADVTAEVMRQLRNSPHVAGIREEGEWLRVNWVAPEWRRQVFGLGRGRDNRDFFKEDLGLDHFEADVDPIRRYFADTGAQIARPRRCYVDIETDSRVPPAIARQGKARVLVWAVTDENATELGRGCLEAETDEAEAALLTRLWKLLEAFDQIASWYGDGFDFPILRARSDLVGAEHRDFRAWLFIDHMEVYARNNKNSAESGDEKDSLKLNDVAMAKVGEGKHDFDATKTHEAWAAGGERRERLVEYCVQDTKLMPKIERATGYLALNDAVCEVCQLFADTRSTNPTIFVDGYMLRLGVEHGVYFRTRKWEPDDEKKHEKYAGAWVMEPSRKGIVKNVHVADFSGMYPSIIETWNMSPETRRDIPPNGPIPEGHCRAPSTRVGFVNEPRGILALAVEGIGGKRKFWSKRQAELPPGTTEWRYAGGMSMAFKVVRNSFYGVAGSPAARFFDRQVAESITQNGVWLIQMTIHEGDKRGIEAIYGDTDALNATNVSRNDFAAFVDWCNRELYPPAIADTGCLPGRNRMEIAYEKEFERIVYVSAKRYTAAWRHYKWTTTCTCTNAKGDPGALDIRTMKCRDCGLVHTELPPPRGEPEVKGLEYKRGDATVLARNLQWECIQKLMVDLSETPADFVPIVERVRDHILNDPLDIKEIRKSMSLSKSIKEYAPPKVKKDGTIGEDLAQVKIAKILKERGEQIEEGVRVEWYVVDASVSPQRIAPAADYAGECDRFYVWESQVWPATKRLLEAAFPGHDWRQYDRVRPKKQRGVASGQSAFDWNPGSKPSRTGKPAPAGQGALFELPSPAASSAHGATPEAK